MNQARPVVFTPRELEILRYVAQGKSRKEISIMLHIAIGTVDTYLKRMYMKLEVHSMKELSVWAILNGYGSRIEL